MIFPYRKFCESIKCINYKGLQVATKRDAIDIFEDHCRKKCRAYKLHEWLVKNIQRR